MTYALIVDGYVTNLIWLHPMNAYEFPTAVPTNGLPAQIGDSYTGGKFYRDGVEVTAQIKISISEQEFVDKLIAEVSE